MISREQAVTIALRKVNESLAKDGLKQRASESDVFAVKLLTRPIPELGILTPQAMVFLWEPPPGLLCDPCVVYIDAETGKLTAIYGGD